MKNKAKNNKIHIPSKNTAKLAVNQKSRNTQRREGYISRIIPKTMSRIQADISTWKRALRAADNVDSPRRARLYNLYEDVLLDAHLSAQISLRMNHVLSIPFVLMRDKKEAQEETELLQNAAWVAELNTHILWTTYYGHTLLELTTDPEGNLKVEVLPRNNVVPEEGILLLREDDTAGIDYRNCREYGTWILEFGYKHDYGLLNKTVPHVLFKRFAQSAWVELCEIYGIPPRFIKTDTQNPEMLDRAEQMLKDMGAAAYFIIDQEEDFEFAKGADTNGDVYNNLIAVCKEEISLAVIGAVIGQDTKNGNRSKEESSVKLLDKIIQSDKRMLASYWNGVVLPALVRIGYLPEGLKFVLQQEEDLEKLWNMTKDSMPYMDVNPVWIKDKFGIDVVGKRETSQPTKLDIDTSGFFD